MLYDYGLVFSEGLFAKCRKQHSYLGLRHKQIQAVLFGAIRSAMKGDFDFISFLDNLGRNVGEYPAINWSVQVNATAIFSPMWTRPSLLRGNYGEVLGPFDFQLCLVTFEILFVLLLAQKQAAQFRAAVLIGTASDAWIDLRVAHHSLS